MSSNSTRDASPKKFEVDFIGVGCYKSGTTWLAQCLLEHPEVCFSKDKEVNFFNEHFYFRRVSGSKSVAQGVENDNFSKGLGWYQNQFPSCDGKTIHGEFSVSYMHDVAAPQRIKSTFPDVKLIYVLRNPVDFIYSLYWWRKSSVWEDSSGEENKAEDILSEKEFLHMGYYYKHLKRFFDVFGSDKIKVFLLDEIKEDSEKVFRDTCNFLSIDPVYIPESLNKRVNEARQIKSVGVKRIVSKIMSLVYKSGLKPIINLVTSSLVVEMYGAMNVSNKKYPSIDKDLREKLERVYAEDIAELEKLISKDLSVWKLNREDQKH